MIARFVQKRRIWISILFAIVIFAVIGVSSPVRAQINGGDAITSVFGLFAGNQLQNLTVIIAYIAYLLSSFVSALFIVLIPAMITLATFNDYAGSAIVSIGWVIIRDLANMGFIVALLYMAFNMIFGIKSKGASLLTLIISAGLINFSKMITGLMIDASQVVTLYFIAGFKDIAAGNLIDTFGVTQVLSFSRDQVLAARGNELTQLFNTSIIALLSVMFGLQTVMKITIFFLKRIVVFTYTLVVSPLQWVTKLFPGGDKFGAPSALNTEAVELPFIGKILPAIKLPSFTEALTQGPILAFLLWLIFTVAQFYGGSLNGMFQQRVEALPPNSTLAYQSSSALVPSTIGPGVVLGDSTISQGPRVGYSDSGTADAIVNTLALGGFMYFAVAFAQMLSGKFNASAGKLGRRAGKMALGAAKTLARPITNPVTANIKARSEAVKQRFNEGKLGAVVKPFKQLTPEDVAKKTARIKALRDSKATTSSSLGTRIAGTRLSVGTKQIGGFNVPVPKLGLSEKAKATLAQGKQAREQITTNSKYQALVGSDKYQTTKKRLAQSAGNNEGLLRQSLKTGTKEEQFAATSLLAKKGMLKENDGDLKAARESFKGDDGLYQKLLKQARTGSVPKQGKIRAALISPYRVDQTTGKLVDRTSGETGKRSIVASKISEIERQQTPLAAIREVVKGRQAFLKRSNVKEAESRAPRDGGSAVRNEFHKNMGMVSGLMNLVSDVDFTKISKADMQKDSRLKALQAGAGRDFQEWADSIVAGARQMDAKGKLTDEDKAEIDKFLKLTTINSSTSLDQFLGDVGGRDVHTLVSSAHIPVQEEQPKQEERPKNEEKKKANPKVVIQRTQTKLRELASELRNAPPDRPLEDSVIEQTMRRALRELGKRRGAYRQLGAADDAEPINQISATFNQMMKIYSQQLENAMRPQAGINVAETNRIREETRNEILGLLKQYA